MKTLTTIFAISVMLYIGYAFGNAALDISLWPAESRISCAWLMLCSAFIVGFLNYLQYGKMP